MRNRSQLYIRYKLPDRHWVHHMLSLPILQCLHNQLSMSDCLKLHYQHQLSERRILSGGSNPLPNNYRFHHTDRKWLRNQCKLSNRHSLCDRHILPVGFLLPNLPDLSVFRQLHDKLL